LTDDLGMTTICFMHWIIQNNLFNEAGHHALVSALEHGCITHTIVKVIPFGGGIEPDLIPEGDRAIVMGSHSLVKHAKERGWTPGGFLNDNFTYTAYADGFGRENMLNMDAMYGRFGDIKVPKVFFIRPADDGKAFAGTVMYDEEFEEWRKKVLALEDYSTVDANTEVMICTTKSIRREYRLFVVDGVIVTGSLYRVGSRVISRPDKDEGVWAFAQQMVDRWQPDRAFVLDVAVIDEGYRVVEVNCLNSSGYYAADVSKLVQALNEMKF